MVWFISQQISHLSESSGVDEATLQMAICLFASFPFNAILKRIPDQNVLAKNLFVISISSLYLFGICSLFTGFRTLMISTMFTFLITKYLKSNFMPYINFAFVLSHLAFNHFSLQFFNTYDATKIDITGAQMVLVMKLSGFAWNVHDGRQPQDQLTEYQKNKAVKKQPSLINFLSYAFFYPSLLTGPAFDYIDYDKWLSSELFTDLPESKKPGRKRKRSIPKSGRVAFYRVLQAVGWLLLWQKSGDYLSIDYMFDPDFKQSSFFYKIFYLYALAFIYRLKYYAAWTISEASCILAGLGYNGYDEESGTILWNRVQNIDIFGFETAQNIHAALEAWNQNTNKWLKHYVYLRLAKKGKKPGFKSTLVTFLTSAFWHGTRPGYYLSFATGALLQTCGRYYRRNIRPIFLEADGRTGTSYKFIYDIVSYVITQLALGYLVHPFMILDFKKSLYVWSTVYYYIHIGIFITFFLFSGPFKTQVIGFLKSYQPTKVEKPLDNILKEKREIEQNEGIHLGIPAADFENTDIKKVQEEIEEIKTDFVKWQKAKGIEVEENNFKEALAKMQRDLEHLREKEIQKVEADAKKEN